MSSTLDILVVGVSSKVTLQLGVLFVGVLFVQGVEDDNLCGLFRLNKISLVSLKYSILKLSSHKSI